MSRNIEGSRIDQVLQRAVDAGAVPHVAAIAADADGVFYEGAAGVRLDDAGAKPVSTSTHFRIMSMTKMVATVAALQQVERGELDLSAPVERYVPDFAELQVLDGFDGDTPRLRAPRSKATVKQLITHTSPPKHLEIHDIQGRDVVRLAPQVVLPVAAPPELVAQRFFPRIAERRIAVGMAL